MENKTYLTNNGTAINLNAEELLNMNQKEIEELERSRIKNIGEGYR